MSEIDVINYYQNTVKRLQQECTEKTDVIIFLGERLHRYKQAVEEIKAIAEKSIKRMKFVILGAIVAKLNKLYRNARR